MAVTLAVADSAMPGEGKNVQMGTLSSNELTAIDAWWRAANYLSVGQIYLKDNPLLRDPIAVDQIKPRLLGHWGTTPGLNLLYAHLNRVIVARDLNVIFMAGPGHGGAAPGARPGPGGAHTGGYFGAGPGGEGEGGPVATVSLPRGS